MPSGRSAAVRVGFLAGDFPWEAPPRPIGKLISAGVMARNMTRALGLVADVVPYAPPPGVSAVAERAALTDFLRRVDVLWADAYPGRSAAALQVRHDLDLPCRAVICAQGVMPKAAEAMLLPWLTLLRPRHDSLLFTCSADQAIWHRLVRDSALHEWVVPLPVDEARFHPAGPATRAAARVDLGIPPDAPLLLYVGRLNIQKNVHALIPLLAAVRRTVPDARLCLVGAEDDIVLGEFNVTNAGYVQLLHDLAARHGVEDAVHWAGPRYGDDLARAYAASDVLVNLGFYHRENFGLSQAEAQACGLPVVCSDWGGFRDIVLHRETGYRVETAITGHGVRVDTAAAAAHVLDLLTDHDLLLRMGRRAAEVARARFAIPAVAAQLAPVVNAAPASITQGSSGDAAYTPTDFACAIEAHKRECGWYDPQRKEKPAYPPMFQDAAYMLYEILMAPYATHVARFYFAAHPPPNAVPTRTSDLQFDPDQSTVHDPDPVWPHGRILGWVEWETLRQVDGVKDVTAIVNAVTSENEHIYAPLVHVALRWLYADGFLFLPLGVDDAPSPAAPDRAAPASGDP
jgi:glycosyltransferase involved in cell wall biosynthesis